MIAHHLTAVVVEERYRQLRADRRWYRTTGRHMFGDRAADLEQEIITLLREIVRIRWAVRRAERAGR